MPVTSAKFFANVMFLGSRTVGEIKCPVLYTSSYVAEIFLW